MPNPRQCWPLPSWRPLPAPHRRRRRGRRARSASSCLRRGGNADVVARLLQVRLQETLGQPVVVENRPGAGGGVGAAAAARAAADGYTLLIGSNGPLSVNPVVQARLPYDPAKDFAPIAMAMQVPHCLVVQPASPFRSVADVVEASKREADRIGVGTAGVASATHLALKAFKAQSGARLLHVPYRGGGPAMPDFVAGNLPMLFIDSPPPCRASRRQGAHLAVASARGCRCCRMCRHDRAGCRGFTAASKSGWWRQPARRRRCCAPRRAMARSRRKRSSTRACGHGREAARARWRRPRASPPSSRRSRTFPHRRARGDIARVTMRQNAPVPPMPLHIFGRGDVPLCRARSYTPEDRR